MFIASYKLNLFGLLHYYFNMKHGCPNPNCPHYQSKQFIVKGGTFFRKSDSRYIQRYHSLCCDRYFSSATFAAEKGQKKRRVNLPLRELLSSGVSMRRAAIILKIHQKTVQRKLKFLAQKARQKQEHFLTSLKSSVNNLQFDDMITSEHTKLKPLTITLAVDEKRRYILGGIVGEIPAFGLLVERSIKKYGHRPNKHPVCISTLFDKIKGAIKHNATIQSDEHQTYPGFVKKYFPNATHQCHKGGRACIVGQGELKKLHFDPLFTINHTCAILRANINRLIRKTWCTTKVISNLQDHIDLFIDYYNFSLLQKNKKTPQRFSF